MSKATDPDGFNAALSKWRATRDGYAGMGGVLGEALAYAMDGGGKMVRPKLCVISASAVLPDWSKDNSATSAWRKDLVVAAATAVEMIHSYSLIHDDLPCMDNDDMRRGRPTLHKAYGEATALLAGDALLTDSFAIIAAVPVPPEHAADAMACIRELATAAGGEGMVLGQAQDLANAAGSMQDSGSALKILEQIHRLKTGALLGAACALGAAAAGGSKKAIDAFRFAGVQIGVAFQVMDDLLDDSPNTGKTKGKDAAEGKQTYLNLLGRSAGLELVQGLTSEALQGLKEVGILTPDFEKFAAALCRRKF